MKTNVLVGMRCLWSYLNGTQGVRRKCDRGVGTMGEDGGGKKDLIHDDLLIATHITNNRIFIASSCCTCLSRPFASLWTHAYTYNWRRGGHAIQMLTWRHMKCMHKYWTDNDECFRDRVQCIFELFGTSLSSPHDCNFYISTFQNISIVI